MMASGKKGKMAAIKKRSVSLMEKRTNNMLPRSGQVDDLLLEDNRAENSNEILVEMNDLEGLVVIGDEMGDPDIGVLVQQEEELT